MTHALMLTPHLFSYNASTENSEAANPFLTSTNPLKQDNLEKTHSFLPTAKKTKRAFKEALNSLTLIGSGLAALSGSLTITGLSVYHGSSLATTFPIPILLGLLGAGLLTSGIHKACLERKNEAKEEDIVLMDQEPLSTVIIDDSCTESSFATLQFLNAYSYRPLIINPETGYYENVGTYHSMASTCPLEPIYPIETTLSSPTVPIYIRSHTISSINI